MLSLGVVRCNGGGGHYFGLSLGTGDKLQNLYFGKEEREVGSSRGKGQVNLLEALHMKEGASYEM